MENVHEVLGKITDFLKTEAKTETLIGQQFQLGEFTCVPVIALGLGLGVGGGEGNSKDKGQGTGAGGGGGIGMAPIGFLVTRGSEIQFVPARSSRGLSAAFEKMPEVLEKYFEKNKAEKVN